MLFVVFFFFKQKTAYEMRISDWSSDVCSSDLIWASLRTSRPTTARARAGRIYALTEELFDPSTCTDPARWELEIAKLAAEVAGVELEKSKRTAELDETRRLMREADEETTQGEMLEVAEAQPRAVKDGQEKQDAA